MFYFLNKLLFKATTKWLIRKFKVCSSDKKNRVFAQRAQDIDRFLLTGLAELRCIAEKHAWDFNKKESRTGQYVDRLSEDTKNSAYHSPYYSLVRHSTREIPDKSNVDFNFDDFILDPATIQEAEEKLMDLIEGDYEDNQQE